MRNGNGPEAGLRYKSRSDGVPNGGSVMAGNCRHTRPAAALAETSVSHNGLMVSIMSPLTWCFC
jgi:hypothetical protein